MNVTTIISVVLKVFELWMGWKKKHNATTDVTMTEKEQKAHAKIIQKIDHAERANARQLRVINSLRQRAAKINDFKNNDL